MKIVFLHHHLRPGGVTKVIEEQIKSLNTSAKPLVVVGEPPSRPVPFPLTVVPAISYDRDRNDSTSPDKIARSIMNAAFTEWKDGPDLFHIHNPILGKNRDFIKVISVLISMGANVLLQIHDFAEDGRPYGYRGEEYPADCHYGVINKRDFRILLRSGLKEEGLHYIPNPVHQLNIKTDSKDKDIILYPIRAIRRKNIGEAVFVSLFVADNRKVGITLEPTSLLDKQSYHGWVDFVKSEKLKVLFRLGVDDDYESVLSMSCCMITTSVKEGFGLAYLEPWGIGRMLFGRLLPDICSDFIQKGLSLDHLYEKILIPLDYMDWSMFAEKWKNCYMEKLKLYGLPYEDRKIDEEFQKLIEEECIDFCYLNGSLQKQVIQNLLNSKKKYKKVLDINPFLENIVFSDDEREIVETNKKVVESEYSLQNNRKNLLKVYERVLNRKVTHSINKRVLLETFNTPQQSYLLLCDSAYG
jgi:glycosyltransferase involved in cell wall biosynthesis